MKPVVIGFSGKISSGKSTLVSTVANSLGFARASFGDYVRSVAGERGLDDSREQLQAVGESLVNGDVTQFCLSVLAQAGWLDGQPLIVDGIRHRQVLETMKQLVAPLPFLLVFVQTDEAVREERLRREEDIKQGWLQQIDAHSTEVQVQSVLSNLADLTVDGSKSIEELTREILYWAKGIS